jgi:hypothetical protein
VYAAEGEGSFVNEGKNAGGFGTDDDGDGDCLDSSNSLVFLNSDAIYANTGIFFLDPCKNSLLADSLILLEINSSLFTIFVSYEHTINTQTKGKHRIHPKKQPRYYAVAVIAKNHKLMKLQKNL